MTHAFLPRLMEPSELVPKLGATNLLIVDLSRADVHAQGHVPGAVHLDYDLIVASSPPATGLLPDSAHLSNVMSTLGLTPQTHVVAYDGEGNSRAARFLWTLDAIDHDKYSLLNGGLSAWRQFRGAISTERATPTPSSYAVTGIRADVIADKEWILQHLDNPDVVLLDARTEEEYEGSVVRADVGGHIPGAVNFDYANAIDNTNGMRIKPFEELRQEFERLGVTSDKEVVVYCQTHHRSAHTYFVLKQLGFSKVRGYPGSWSEWGNDPDAPIDQD